MPINDKLLEETMDLLRAHSEADFRVIEADPHKRFFLKVINDWKQSKILALGGYLQYNHGDKEIDIHLSFFAWDIWLIISFK